MAYKMGEKEQGMCPTKWRILGGICFAFTDLALASTTF